jgi:hypothetical protein
MWYKITAREWYHRDKEELVAGFLRSDLEKRQILKFPVIKNGCLLGENIPVCISLNFSDSPLGLVSPHA